MKRILTFVVILLGSFVHAQDSSSSAERTNTSLLPKPGPVTASDQWKPHIGLVASSVHAEGSYDAGAGYGLEIGFQPYIPFGLGLELTKSENEGRKDLDDLSQTMVLARGTYNFGGSNYFIRNSYAGLAIGRVEKSGDAYFAGAPLVGFDLPIQEKAHNYITLGASAKHLIIEGNEPDALLVNGVVKYWY